jgi:hypothetical protein
MLLLHVAAKRHAENDCTQYLGNPHGKRPCDEMTRKKNRMFKQVRSSHQSLVTT